MHCLTHTGVSQLSHRPLMAAPMNTALMSMEQRLARGSMDIESELKTSRAQVRLVRYRFREPPDSMLRVDGKFRVELCLTSRHRTARACFRDLWSLHRYERIGALFLVPPGMDVLARSDED